jgi:hypothetical protein
MTIIPFNAFFIVIIISAACAKTVNISNVALRRDVNGEWMDIHDGTVLSQKDPTTGKVTFLYYGMGYQNCTIQHSWFPPHWCPGIYQPFGQCGFRTDHAVRLYTSPDLSSWTLASKDVFPVKTRPYGIYFRAKVIFCRLTSKYVLWLNFLANASSPLAAYPNAQLLVATSLTPEGPFEFLNFATGLAHAGAGDFTLITVAGISGEEAFVAYGSWSTEHSIAIEKLNDNFTNSLGLINTSGIVSPPGNEAPVLFHRNGWFYFLFGECCCFCQEGAATKALVARNLLGPWKPLGRWSDSTEAVDLNPRRANGSRIIPSQNNYVLTIPSALGTSPDNETFIWMGDRWASALDGIFGHDLQSWHILRFEDTDDSAACIKEFTWQNWFLVDV